VDQGQALIVVLRAAGVKLRLDADGDLDVGGKPKALAVWHALDEAIDNLGDLVAEALRGGAVPRSDTTKLGAEQQEPTPVSEEDAKNAALEKWCRFGDGCQAMLGRANGDPSSIGPVDRAGTPGPLPGKARAPMHAGVRIATLEFQRWRALYQDAMRRGENQIKWLEACGSRRRASTSSSILLPIPTTSWRKLVSRGSSGGNASSTRM
jgi:hypothetical protein